MSAEKYSHRRHLGPRQGGISGSGWRGMTPLPVHPDFDGELDDGSELEIYLREDGGAHARIVTGGTHRVLDAWDVAAGSIADSLLDHLDDMSREEAERVASAVAKGTEK